MTVRMLSLVPSSIDLLQADVIASLGCSSREGRKLASCRPRHSCNSPFCPRCVGRKAYKQGHELYEAASTIPLERLKLATLNAANVPLEELHDAARYTMKAGRSLMKKLGIAQYALKQEQSLVKWDDLYQPHNHILMSTAPSGRAYISEASLQDAWLSELPSWLYPSLQAVHFERIEDSIDRNLMTACRYATKSPYHKTGSTNALGRIIDGIFATKGMKKFEPHGSFRLGNAGNAGASRGAPCRLQPDAASGGVWSASSHSLAKRSPHIHHKKEK